MDIKKITDNLKFTVKYSDGATRNVAEGVLFEFNADKITLHLGTDRKECLFSIAEALTETIIEMGLGEEFEEYVTKETETECEHCGSEHGHERSDLGEIILCIKCYLAAIEYEKELDEQANRLTLRVNEQDVKGVVSK